MEISTVPTIRVNFLEKLCFQEDMWRHITKAEESGCWSVICTSNENRVKEEIFASNQEEKITEFAKYLMKEGGKIKPVLTLNYGGDFNCQKKIQRTLCKLARIFGGQIFFSSANNQYEGCTILFFKSNYMRKAFAMCMKWL